MDINGIGYYTLGKHRKALTDDQKNKYQKIFRNYFLKAFQIGWLNIKKLRL